MQTDSLVPDEVLDKAKKWLIEGSKKWGPGHGITCGQAWDLGGNLVAGRAYTACHAWVQSAFHKESAWADSYFGPGGWSQKYTDKSRNFLTLTCHSKGRSKGICSTEAHEAIILWLASDESPFSQFILNKDDEDSLLNGGLVILCGPQGASLAQTMWLCKALRYGIEGAKALDVWLSLKKGGVDPLLAFLVATHIRTVQGATFGYTGPDGHSTVFGNNSKPFLGGLLTRNFRERAPNTSDVFVDPKGVKIPSDLYYNYADTITGFCKPVQKSDGWGGTVNGRGATASEMIERTLKWQRELEAHLGDYTPVVEKAPEKLWGPTSDTVYLELDM